MAKVIIRHVEENACELERWRPHRHLNSEQCILTSWHPKRKILALRQGNVVCRSKHGGRTTMKKKNPAITAVLNFFLPGLGFTYLGSPFFIAVGIAFFVLIVAAIVIGAASSTTATSTADIADAVVSILIDLIWA